MCVDANFARTLEREIAAQTRRVEELEKDRQETIHRLQSYGKTICWHPVISLDAAAQQKLHDLLNDAARALLTREKEQAR